MGWYRIKVLTSCLHDYLISYHCMSWKVFSIMLKNWIKSPCSSSEKGVRTAKSKLHWAGALFLWEIVTVLLIGEFFLSSSRINVQTLWTLIYGNFGINVLISTVGVQRNQVKYGERLTVIAIVMKNPSFKSIIYGNLAINCKNPFLF